MTFGSGVLFKRSLFLLASFAFVTLMATHTQVAVAATAAETSVKLALNWKPEPEFGGFYAALLNGHFKKNGLRVEILPGGAGQPVAQMIAAGKAEFGISSGDEVVMSRSHGADIVAIYNVYQTSPMMIMVHQSSGIKSLEDLFKTDMTLAIERGLPYAKFLEKKYGYGKLKVVPYTGGVAAFLHDKNYAQQGFITSEPLAAKREKSDPKPFLIADAGYDPFTEVVAVKGDYLKEHSDIVKKFIKAVNEGWRDYLKNPKPTNEGMHKLNSGMDMDTFAESALAQKPLIESKGHPVGSMSADRWKRLVDQLLDLKVIDTPVDPATCFAQVK